MGAAIGCWGVECRLKLSYARYYLRKYHTIPNEWEDCILPGPNGFDRLRDTFPPSVSESHESTSPELGSESESNHDSTETVLGMASLRLSGQYTAPGVQHNYRDRGGCNQAGITPEETPSKPPAQKPRRGTTSKRGGGPRTAVEGIEFPSSPKRQRSSSATASSDVAANLLEEDKSHGERNLRQSPEENCVYPVATPKQIHIAATIPEDDGSADKDSKAAQKARESATIPDDTVTVTGTSHGVGLASQHTHNSVTSSPSPSAASGPRGSSPLVVRINAQLTPKTASQVSKCTADINVKKTTRKYKNRPDENGMRWFTSFYRGNIVEPKIAEAPLGGDLYFHTNTISSFEQVWMYAGEGQGGWLDITEEYFGEDGTIIHPVERDRAMAIEVSAYVASFWEVATNCVTDPYFHYQIPIIDATGPVLFLGKELNLFGLYA
ncbi:hypothetical protein BD779DRAFT_1474497 [Infundibulicybe gibba]|nr:hypothetical protein BD779DRAFT_1474497 [Infundibulicybe gibba]